MIRNSAKRILDSRFSILEEVAPRNGASPFDKLRTALRLHSANASFHSGNGDRFSHKTNSLHGFAPPFDCTPLTLRFAQGTVLPH